MGYRATTLTFALGHSNPRPGTPVQALGKHSIICVEDLVHEIVTCGPNFKAATNFLWPFKLSAPRVGCFFSLTSLRALPVGPCAVASCPCLTVSLAQQFKLPVTYSLLSSL